MTLQANDDRRQALRQRLDSAKADLAAKRQEVSHYRDQADTNHALAAEQELPANVTHYNHRALGWRLKAMAAERECTDIAGRVSLLEMMLADPDSPGAVALDPKAVAAVDECAGVTA